MIASASMRIPPSVIVMSLVTAVPFALAIRDTAKDKPPVAEDDGWDPQQLPTEDPDVHVRDFEQDERRRVADTAKHASVIAKLFGAKPAMIGPMFDGVELGGPSSSFQSEDARQRLEVAGNQSWFAVRYDFDDVRLNAITFEILS